MEQGGLSWEPRADSPPVAEMREVVATARPTVVEDDQADSAVGLLAVLVAGLVLVASLIRLAIG